VRDKLHPDLDRNRLVSSPPSKSLEKIRPWPIGRHCLLDNHTSHGFSLLGADYRKVKGSGTVSARSTHTLFPWMNSLIASKPISLP
jgi:hypothetical protein